MGELVAFAPRPQRQEPPPALRCAELRLSGDCRVVALTLLDEMGNAEVLEYALSSAPPDFNFGKLRAAWNGWRDRGPASVS